MAATNDPEPPEYLEDPEAELSVWPEEIWADNENLARQRCREIGTTRRGRLMKIEQVGRSGKRWRCIFRSYE
ncbi:MAG: hypothetical protein AAGA60_15760 [Cyanobacteria bacterium P01_E01_bin.42]